jgi:SAM-dependent methyltransferase
VADWYIGWVGAHGSDHHRQLAIPAVLHLLDPQPGEAILDLGAGHGVLAPEIAASGAKYTGVDVSSRLLAYARKYHGHLGRFIQGDVTRLFACRELQAHSYDAAVFLLSIQDIEPLEAALASAAWAVRSGGRIVMLMTHPCFRVPRQSGWGYDAERKLRYRRIDRYLSRLDVPMKSYGRNGGVTISRHRPLSDYINGLATCGFFVDAFEELPTYQEQGQRDGDDEIPLFLALRAVG